MAAGDILIVHLGTGIGAETHSKHSAVVLNDPALHPRYGLLTVAPLLKIKPFHLAYPHLFPIIYKSALNKLDIDRVVDPFNIKAVSREPLRILGIQGKLTSDELEEVRLAVGESMQIVRG